MAPTREVRQGLVTRSDPARPRFRAAIKSVERQSEKFGSLQEADYCQMTLRIGGAEQNYGSFCS